MLYRLFLLLILAAPTAMLVLTWIMAWLITGSVWLVQEFKTQAFWGLVGGIFFMELGFTMLGTRVSGEAFIALIVIGAVISIPAFYWDRLVLSAKEGKAELAVRGTTAV